MGISMASSAFSILALLSTVTALLFLDQQSLYIMLLLASVTVGSLVFAFIYGASQESGDVKCKDLDGGENYPNDSDCRQYVVGFVFFFFQGLLTWAAVLLPPCMPLCPVTEEDRDAVADADDAAVDAGVAAEAPQKM